MCSVYEEKELSQPERKNAVCVVVKSCMKCDQRAVVVIRVADAMCRSCFVEYVTHKFRAAFGKSKVVRDQERVVVAFSGGAGSAAMVHLIQEGLSKRAMKKLRFIPSLVFIEDGAVIQSSAEERRENTEEIVALMRKTGLNCSVYSLEQGMSCFEEEEATVAPPSDRVCLQPLATTEDDEALSNLMTRLSVNEGDAKKLEKLLAEAKSLTAKTRLVDILQTRLLSEVARQHGVTKVLLGDSGSRLSVRLLSNIAQGQGAHLPYEIGFADRRDKDITYIRPLREFTAKEIAVYNQLNQVKTHFIPNLSTKVSSHGSIHQLTESFVSGLQAEYPNTVSTIFRTGEKFDLSERDLTEDDRCVLCKCPLDTDVGLSSALSATQLSRSLCANMAASQKGSGANEGTTGCCQGEDSCPSNKAAPSETCCGEGDGSCSQIHVNRINPNDLDLCLCYGCRLLIRDLNSLDALPDGIKNEVARKWRRTQMKQEISEFLLEEN